jgi:hypothetical protein
MRTTVAPPRWPSPTLLVSHTDTSREGDAMDQDRDMLASDEHGRDLVRAAKAGSGGARRRGAVVESVK